MMREIKFRALEVETGNIVVGSYIKEHGYRQNNGVPDYSKKVIRHYILDDTNIRHEIAEDTLGQYTGRKDKNGVEIYEGDIVQLTDVKSRTDMYEVVIKDGCIMLSSFDEDWVGRIINTDIKVIGNIYENKDLL